VLQPYSCYLQALGYPRICHTPLRKGPPSDVVRETAALTDRPFGGNFALTSDQHRRVDQALSAGLRIEVDRL